LSEPLGDEPNQAVKARAIHVAMHRGRLAMPRCRCLHLRHRPVHLSARSGAHEKMPGSSQHAHNAKAQAMDAEHINQIGNQIADLNARTEELRGYL
jgi:hypothetical protein